MGKDASRESFIRTRLFFKQVRMTKLKKKLGIKPKFTDNELIAMRVLSGLYLEGVDWKQEGTDPLVKKTLESIKEKVKDW